MLNCVTIDPVVWTLSQIYELMTPNPPCPSDIKGIICLAHVHSHMNMHTCAKFGPDRSSCLAYFPHFCMYDPLTHPNIPLGLDRLILFSLCPFPDESAYVCQIWSRSVQWFSTGPSVTDKVSSVLSRCWR